MRRRAAVAGMVAAVLAASPAKASPWAEPGDMALRNDIQILVDHRVVRGPVTTWPISWRQLSDDLEARRGDSSLPAFVRRSLERVRARIGRETARGRPRAGIDYRLTSSPDLWRTFDDTARNDVDLRNRVEIMAGRFAGRLQANYRTAFGTSGRFDLDGSYVAAELGNWTVHVGAIERWWGPGRDGGLVLSTNARPVPAIGLARNRSTPFDLPVLRWLGPWRLALFVGQLEKDRTVSRPLLAGVRANIMPFESLEIGVSRVAQLCGSGRPCGLDIWKKVLLGEDNIFELGFDQTKEPGNQLAGIDFRWAPRPFGMQIAFYGEIGAEDEAGGLPSKLIGLFGTELWGGSGPAGANWRLTAEYADTAAGITRSEPLFNLAYEHTIYYNGYRYRDRALGYTLDNDGRFYSLNLFFVDARNKTYRLSLQRAEINRDGTGNNRVSGTKKDLLQVVAAVTVPFGRGRLQLAGRVNNDGQADGSDELGAAIALRWTTGF